MNKISINKYFFLIKIIMNHFYTNQMYPSNKMVMQQYNIPRIPAYPYKANIKTPYNNYNNMPPYGQVNFYDPVDGTIGPTIDNFPKQWKHSHHPGGLLIDVTGSAQDVKKVVALIEYYPRTPNDESNDDFYNPMDNYIQNPGNLDVEISGNPRDVTRVVYLIRHKMKDFLAQSSHGIPLSTNNNSVSQNQQNEFNNHVNSNIESSEWDYIAMSPNGQMMNVKLYEGSGCIFFEQYDNKFYIILSKSNNMLGDFGGRIETVQIGAIENSLDLNAKTYVKEMTNNLLVVKSKTLNQSYHGEKLYIDMQNRNTKKIYRYYLVSVTGLVNYDLSSLINDNKYLIKRHLHHDVNNNNDIVKIDFTDLSRIMDTTINKNITLPGTNVTIPENIIDVLRTLRRNHKKLMAVYNQSSLVNYNFASFNQSGINTFTIV